MRSFRAAVSLLAVMMWGGVVAVEAVAAQTAPLTSTSTPATLIRLDGQLTTATGAPRTGSVLLVVSLYANQADTTPLWVEQQVVPLDQAGRYTVLAGATQDDGVPQQYFLSGTGRWIGVGVQGETEQPRIRLVSAPYALKAREADTLNGKTSSDFVLTEHLNDTVKLALQAEGVGGTPDAILGASNNVTNFASAGNPQLSDSLHVVAGASGATAIPGLDQIVLENSTTGGMSILTPDTNLSEVVFGTPSDTFGALARWDFTNKAFSIGPANTGSDLVFWADNASEMMRIKSSGNVGIGTPAPVGRLHIVQGASGATAIPGLDQIVLENNTTGGMSILTPDTNLSEIVFGTPSDAFGALLRWDFSNKAFSIGSASGGSDLVFWADNASEKVRITSTGNVGIGTASPSAKLHVAGDVHVTGNTIVDGNIAAKYQDVAEWVETPAPLEPGTVVIVDPLEPNRVLPAARAYDTRVAGAVSRQPGLVLGERSDTKAMVAQSGRVRVKADARYGAIKIGDLLVTSPTPGYAMRSRPMRIGGQTLHRPGTLLGKALEALPNGQGEILVLLTLQ